jgi:exopolysaccharide biosynthesis predicted pyruvyltransferase EpsI
MKEEKSPFYRFMEKNTGHRKTFFWEDYGNNGDRLITMGAQRVLGETGCKLVDSPDKAEQIVINGGGRLHDAFPPAFERIANYRRQYPSLPLILAPQTFQLHVVDFEGICKISSSPLILFARENNSANALRQLKLPQHCQVYVSQDLAFELRDSEFLANIVKNVAEKHVLIAMRRDNPMRKDMLPTARLLARPKGTWLPQKIRRPLSWVRDRMVAHLSRDTIKGILQQEKVSRELPKIYRDVSLSVGFEEFVAAIRDAALIITDRLHAATLGNLLNKRVVLICSGGYHRHKIKGVYDFSMSGPDSRISLYVTD